MTRAEYEAMSLYDYNMGTLETPTPITEKEDLEKHRLF